MTDGDYGDGGAGRVGDGGDYYGVDGCDVYVMTMMMMMVMVMVIMLALMILHADGDDRDGGGGLGAADIVSLITQGYAWRSLNESRTIKKKGQRERP